MHGPRFQALVLLEVDQREWVAGVRVDRSQHGSAGRQVVRVAATEALPVPFRAPGDDPLGAGAPDSADQVFMKLAGSIQQAPFG
jgi:hypothetical protein